MREYYTVWGLCLSNKFSQRRKTFIVVTPFHTHSLSFSFDRPLYVQPLSLPGVTELETNGADAYLKDGILDFLEYLTTLNNLF